MTFHFCLGYCRNYVWAVGHVTVCLFIKAFGGEVVFGREQIGEIDLLGDTEDGGKGWSRGGLKEEGL